MSQYRKAIAAFIGSAIATIGTFTTTLVVEAPKATTQAVGILGAVSTFLATLLTYIAPANDPA